MAFIEPKNSTLLFRFNVNGLPKPKGSLKPTGRIGQRVKLIEQVDPKKIWRTTVSFTAGATRSQFGIREPINDPVGVLMIFRMEKPKKPRFRLPATRGGDIDKLQRNVFDALQDAGVLSDDARAVSVRVDKVYAGTGEEPGVYVEIWSV